ncbi:hypothetical protein [Embleya scabrispora]|uniref:hypothetical protein n=1 Tax=Embleya scabrispora TaxID=159449 RepID=UPI0003608F1E|nr:hypothetical protein [Embleya scabrispora]MYS87102.1 hypothetical protein [Streptomyces sp. SID5474]
MRTHGEHDADIRPEPPARRRPLIVGLAIVAVLGVGGGAWAVLGDEESPRSTTADPGAAASSEPGAPAGETVQARPGTPASGNAAGPDTSTSSPNLPSGAPHTFYPAQDDTRFSRYTVAPDGRTLTAWLWGGQCETNRLVVASESATQVAVRVEITRIGDMCTDMAVENKANVTLPTPLGTRALVDAETGARITPGGKPFSVG